MDNRSRQGEFFAIIGRPLRHPFKLRVNDAIRIEGKIGLVMRVTECAAVVVKQPVCEFTTRFDKRVRFQPSPAIVRISPNSETEILNRAGKRLRRERRAP